MKLANYFNRQFTDHISTHEWDGCCPNDWRWTLEPLSLSSAAIVPMTDPMCHRSPKMLLALNEKTDGTHNGPAQPSRRRWTGARLFHLGRDLRE